MSSYSNSSYASDFDDDDEDVATMVDDQGNKWAVKLKPDETGFDDETTSG